MRRFALLALLMFGLGAFAQETTKAEKKTSTTTTTTTTTATQAQAAAAKEVPTLDGGLGPCSAEFHITDPDGKPIYNAQIHTLIKSRAFGIKKTDLQLSTNFDGRAKFTGLPDVNKRPTFFDIRQGQKTAVREFSPGENCHPVFDVILGNEVVVNKDK